MGGPIRAHSTPAQLDRPWLNPESPGDPTEVLISDPSLMIKLTSSNEMLFTEATASALSRNTDLEIVGSGGGQWLVRCSLLGHERPWRVPEIVWRIRTKTLTEWRSRHRRFLRATLWSTSGRTDATASDVLKNPREEPGDSTALVEPRPGRVLRSYECSDIDDPPQLSQG
jgi:hypothetical protein